MERENGGKFETEYRAIGIEDGKERWIAASGRAFFNRWGEAVRFIGTTRDITGQRQAMEALRESEQRFRATFNNAALGIVEVDSEDRFIAVNDRICRILGYRKEELIGMTVHQLTAPEDRERSDVLNAELRQGCYDTFSYEKEVSQNGTGHRYGSTLRFLRSATIRAATCGLLERLKT